MKIIKSISFAFIMAFLFSTAQESFASKHSANIQTDKKQNNISPESMANIIFAQAKRPGPPGRMSGQRREPSSNRGPQLGNKRPGKPLQGNDRQQRMKRRGAGRQGQSMGENGGPPPMEAGGDSGVSEVQSDQGTGEIAPGSQPSNRGSKFRKKMRKARRNKIRQRMQRRGARRQGQSMGENGGPPPMEAGGGSEVSEVQSDQGAGEISPGSKRSNRGSKFRKNRKIRNAKRNKARQKMQRGGAAGPQDQKMRQMRNNRQGKRGGPKGSVGARGGQRGGPQGSVGARGGQRGGPQGRVGARGGQRGGPQGRVGARGGQRRGPRGNR